MYDEFIPPIIIPSFDIANVLSLGTLLLNKLPSNPFSIINEGLFTTDFLNEFDFFLGYFNERSLFWFIKKLL